MYPVFYRYFVPTLTAMAFTACAHKEQKIDPKDAARIDPKLMRETVVYEPGSEHGAVVPDISAPQLRAIWVEERIENGRLIEAHREWQLEGDVVILGTSQPQGGRHEKN